MAAPLLERFDRFGRQQPQHLGLPWLGEVTILVWLPPLLRRRRRAALKPA